MTRITVIPRSQTGLTYFELVSQNWNCWQIRLSIKQNKAEKSYKWWRISLQILCLNFLEKTFYKTQKAFFLHIDRMVIFSDNCAGQFKSKITVPSLCTLKDEFSSVEVEWNFFASRHDKGAVDGVGATVKCYVWMVT